MLLLMGVLMALTPNIAQLRGEGRRAAVGPLGISFGWPFPAASSCS